MQYISHLVAALTCFSLNLQAARVHSKAKFVPAWPLPRPLTARPAVDEDSSRPAVEKHVYPKEDTLGIYMDMQKEPENVAAPEQMDQSPAEQSTEPYRPTEGTLWDYWLIAETQAIGDLVGQPATPLGLEECLGRGIVLPKMDYQIKGGKTSTPAGAFGIIEGDLRALTEVDLVEGPLTELTLSTPWKTEKQSAIDVKELVFKSRDWANVERGECCGLQAEISVKSNLAGAMVAKIRCLGAPENDKCLVRNVLQKMMTDQYLGQYLGRESCAAGYKCQESQFPGIGDIPDRSFPGIGLCLPE